ncbi:hypothetical protein AQUCO_03100050v1 [Aquilegia coerulea]|uniref:GRF-type domain-containing protein n=1 Tax=Aquilegia coerulea TaxID=218851 RepID=A0A2G5D0I4_AQUCA|nr:hypothetical protein AQUCO_03100050v1 [Aquilegia coerulea]
MAWTDENAGRRFFGCSKYVKKNGCVFRCQHFKWVDEAYPTLRDRLWGMYAQIDGLKERNEELEIKVTTLKKNKRKEEENTLQWKTRAQELEKEVENADTQNIYKRLIYPKYNSYRFICQNQKTTFVQMLTESSALKKKQHFSKCLLNHLPKTKNTFVPKHKTIFVQNYLPKVLFPPSFFCDPAVLPSASFLKENLEPTLEFVASLAAKSCVADLPAFFGTCDVCEASAAFPLSFFGACGAGASFVACDLCAAFV